MMLEVTLYATEGERQTPKQNQTLWSLMMISGQDALVNIRMKPVELQTNN